MKRLGSLDVLVNAHGIEGPTGPVTALDPADVRRTFEVNVLSMFWLCGAATEIFEVAGGGRIVNMASGAGLAGGAFTGVYHASKHAVVGLTRSLARELGPLGIAVNAVCPGFVESPMVDRIVSALGDLDLPTEYAHTVPMGRYADPDEVAETVRYLACEAPDYMTGRLPGTGRRPPGLAAAPTLRLSPGGAASPGGGSFRWRCGGNPPRRRRGGAGGGGRVARRRGRRQPWRRGCCRGSCGRPPPATSPQSGIGHTEDGHLVDFGMGGNDPLELRQDGY